MADDGKEVSLSDSLSSFGTTLKELPPTFMPPSVAGRGSSPLPLVPHPFDEARYIRARLVLEIAAESGEGVILTRADVQTLIIGIGLGVCAMQRNFSPPMLTDETLRHAPFVKAQVDDREGRYLVSPFGGLVSAVHPAFRDVIAIGCGALRLMAKKSTAEPKPGVKYVVGDSVEITSPAAFANAPIPVPVVILGVAVISGLTVLGWKAIGESGDTDRKKLHMDAEIVKAAAAAAAVVEISVAQMKEQAKAGQKIEPSAGLIGVLKNITDTGTKEPASSRIVDALIGGGVVIAIGGAIAYFTREKRKKKDKAA